MISRVLPPAAGKVRADSAQGVPLTIRRRTVRRRGFAAATAVLTFGLTTAGAGVASAEAAPQADVQISVNAPRHILPSGGWTSVSAEVRNLGDAPASDVEFTLTLPPELQITGSTTSSEWDCAFAGQVSTCTHVGDVAPGATPYPLTLTAGVTGAAAGDELAATATVSTSSPESTTSNNTAERPFTIVGKGTVRGSFWNDLNADGVRQPGEPSVDPGSISIRAIDDEDDYGSANTHNGTFSYQVPAKRYRAEVRVWPDEWTYTTPNVGDDTTDSDFTEITENGWYRTAVTDSFTVAPDGTITVDVGLIAV